MVSIDMYGLRDFITIIVPLLIHHDNISYRMIQFVLGSYYQDSGVRHVRQNLVFVNRVSMT